jgi:glycosyltransferase involved in cell wall biosynthesis
LGCERVRFLEEVQGAAQAAAYRQADLFVLPSHTENFGIVVAEALSHGVPALVCKGAPWAGLEQHGCGWWVEQGERPIAAALSQALALGDVELRAMGALGRAWVEQEFSKRRVAQMMRETYDWLLGGGAKPAWVQ